MKSLAALAIVLTFVTLAATGSVGSQSSTQGVWSEKARLPEPRGEVAAAAVDGKIYVLGGSASGNDAQTLNEEYTPATDRWRVRAPMPSGLSHVGAAGMNGKIYVVGGFTRNVHMDARDVAFEYDPATNSWKSAAPLPTPRSSTAVTFYKGLILVAGGECNNGKTFVENEAYDPKTDRWQSLAPMMPTGRHGFRAATVGPYAYFPGGAGGCGGGAVSDTMLVFSLP